MNSTNSGSVQEVYGKKIVILLIATIFILSATFAWQVYKNNEETKKFESFAKAEAVYSLEIEALENKLKPLSDKLAAEKNTKKKEEIQSLIDSQQADHSKSLAAFLDVYKSLHPHPQGSAAAVRAAGIFVKQKKFENAISLLEKLYPKSKSSLRVQIGMALINLYHQNDKIELALPILDDLVKQSTNKEFKAELLVQQADLLRQQNKSKQAINIAKQIIKEYSDSKAVQKAYGLLAILNRK